MKSLAMIFYAVILESAVIGYPFWAFSADVVPPPRTLADWKNWPLPNATLHDAEVQGTEDGWLIVEAKKGEGRSGVLLQFDAKEGDLDQYGEIAVPVRNLSDRPAWVVLRVDDDRTTEIPSVQHGKGVHSVTIPVGKEPVWLTRPLGSSKPSPAMGKIIGMQVPPPDLVRRDGVNAGAVRWISVFIPLPKAEQKIAMGPVVARGGAPRDENWTVEQAFPLVDEYGQYVHRDWPGKLHDEKEFAERKAQEEADLASHPRPSDWDPYGGWNAGPEHKATGFFRVEKINGWWWLIDPEGHLFWSHGVVRVGTRVRIGNVYHGTPITDREYMFRLPPKDSPLGAFFGTQPRATGGYYADKPGHAVYDHLEANLFRKYGPEWATEYAKRSQQRLASWAMNTIANSSDPVVYGMQKTPYTAVVYSATVGRDEHAIQGSAGGWGKMPDPFDPRWRDAMRKTLQTDLKNVLNDPWCLGFFVDNELKWGDNCYLAESVLVSPAEQAAKQVFLEQLKKKYETIDRLNAAWKTQYATWEAMGQATGKPDRKEVAARSDLEDFTNQVFDAYFRGCRDAIKEVSPNHMYLGCRFAHWENPKVLEAAAKYCDIVSVNRYSRTVADLRLPAEVDRPVVIGEFSFGAMDRGMFFPGWQQTANQAERAKAYCGYVESALCNPSIVGTHWFQYFDQPTTGRFEGENSQFGLLDICDTPYEEMVGACRKMGGAIYSIRTQAAKHD